ncbi:MAG TPA: type 4a pilus biogenesis protein PilO [Gemmatimonadales bacterium]|jgi:type IV pilus assembly protein PilO|nr:type 4a pilus biogenesis protein PilO [Gemmatimonadales bacterium]
MALSNDPKAVPVLLILVAALVGYMGYTGAVIGMAGLPSAKERTAQVQVVRDSLDLLLAQTDSAKRELARGTAEDLRQRIEGYRSSLVMLRRLVPDRNEVPNLLDDISTRAKIRGVTFAQVAPQGVEEGPVPFNTDTYAMQVIGHYDQIGQFLADIASLPRIIVPYDVSLTAANAAAAKALGDSTGALLEAHFHVRTYVKSPNSDGEGATSGT